LITENIIPTCSEVCASTNSEGLAGGNSDPLYCINQNDDPLNTPCKCYYNGPVNTIIKPMQQFNPFRQIKSLVGTATDFLSTQIGNAVKKFMLPLWNSVKTLSGFLSSIISMIVETITTYANPLYVFNLLKNLAQLGAEEAIAKLKIFYKEILVPALTFIWNNKNPMLTATKLAMSYAWEQLKPVFRELSNAFSSLTVSFLGYAQTGAVYAWDTFIYSTGLVVDTVTPFIPVSKTLKVFLITLSILIYLLIMTGVPKQILDFFKYLLLFFIGIFYNIWVLVTGIVLGNLIS
jgi:hypothetical protein